MFEWVPQVGFKRPNWNILSVCFMVNQTFIRKVTVVTWTHKDEINERFLYNHISIPLQWGQGKRGGCVVVVFGLKLRRIGRVGLASWRENRTQSSRHVLGDVDGVLFILAQLRLSRLCFSAKHPHPDLFALTVMTLDGSSATNPWALRDDGVLVLSNRAPVHALEGSSPSNPWILDKHGGLVLQVQGSKDVVKAAQPEGGEEPTRGSASHPAETSLLPLAPHSRILDVLQKFDAEVNSSRLKFNTRICTARIQSNTRTLRPRPSRNNDENQAPRATPHGLHRVTNSTSLAATWLVIRTAAEKARQSYD
ncbi:hypothetical protein K438DRAFT_1749888 [Mycena galopus ATCC 62051]|nr:hypothetical protein K438DRAFT_1749888 [Mycena galopus ATCC 62051]